MEKTVVEKGPKNGHFPMGLVHGFCPKIDFSRMGVFNRNYVRNNHFLIFWMKTNIVKPKK